MKTSLVLRLLAASGLLALVSCSTVRGVGQDVQTVGHGISHGATSVQREIRN